MSQTHHVWGSNISSPKKTLHNPGRSPSYKIEDNPRTLTPSSPIINDTPHCAYCQCNEITSLVHCPKTNKYFCNNHSPNGKSHIVIHMVKNKVKELELPEENKYHQIPFVCFNCRDNNVFLLSIVQSLAQGKYMVLCSKCINDVSMNPYKLDKSNAMSIIVNDSYILDWLVQPIEDPNLPKISFKDISLLEDAWQKNDKLTILDIPKIRALSTLPKTRLIYDKPELYKSTFKPIVIEEMNYCKNECEMCPFENITVNFEKSTTEFAFNDVWIASFEIKARNDISVGDSIEIISMKTGFKTTAKVIFILFSKFKALFKLNSKENPPPPNPYKIKQIFNEIPYKRQIKCLNELQSRIDKGILDVVLGNIDTIIEKPLQRFKVQNVLNMPELNDSQKAAITKSVQSSFVLIQGPPGTGKTTTVSAIVDHFIRNDIQPILVCAPSNIASDHVTISIGKTGANVTRVYSWSLDDTEKLAEQYSATTKALSRKSEDVKRLKNFLSARKVSILPEADQEKMTLLRKRLEREVVSASAVVVSTLVTSQGEILNDINFPAVIVDEATQATEPEILMALMHKSNKVILVGDQMQLGPVIKSPKAISSGLDLSLFRRLIQIGLEPLMLNVQYRMHPAISQLASNLFYKGALKNGVSISDRQSDSFNWPDPIKPLAFFNVKGEESFEGNSYYNKLEAILCEKILTTLIKAGTNPSKIGIITPYVAQRNYIVDYITATNRVDQNLLQYINVASVDSFQGSENDYIILSTVRSNPKKIIGFLSDKRRLNVSITRAKYGLIIIGDVETLMRCPVWNQLLLFFRDNMILMDGDDLNYMKPAKVVIETLTPPSSEKDKNYSISHGDNGVDMLPEEQNDPIYPSISVLDNDYF